VAASRRLGPVGLGHRLLGCACLALAAELALGAAAVAGGYAPAKWDVRFSGAGTVQFGKPVLADLDGDGHLWVIFGTVSTNGQGAVYVLNPHDGSVRPGWPQITNGAIASTPAVGDLLGDGGREIVVTSGENANLGNPASVYAFRKDGSLSAGGAMLWPPFTPSATPSSHTFSSPAIADLNGDGKEDVVFGSFSQYVYALSGPTGTPLPGWPAFVRDGVFSSPAIADLAGDGKLEVIIGSQAHAEGSPINAPNGGALWVFRADGSYYPGFPQYVSPESIDSSPAIGDILGNGCPAIVVGTTNTTDTGGKVLYAFHNDGTPVAGWPVSLAGHTFSSPLLVDLDGDGDLDVVANDDTGLLYGLKGDGTTLFQMRPKDISGRSAVSIGEMAAAQIGSNNPVLVLGGVGFDVTLVSKTGTQLSDDGTHGPTMLAYTTTNEVQGPAVGDLENNGTLQIVAASGTNDGSNDVHVIAWNAGSRGTLQWPMFRRDSKHRATVPLTTPHHCPRVQPPLAFYTVTPCRISDSRLAGNGSYGGPPLVGGEIRTMTVTGSWSGGGCNIPPGASAISLNVTITGPTAEGYLALFPGGDGFPGTSSINFSANQTRANNAVVPLSFNGLGHLSVGVGLPPGNQVNVIIDTNGYFQ
jgi:hypothetical protein